MLVLIIINNLNLNSNRCKNKTNASKCNFHDSYRLACNPRACLYS